MLKRVKSVFLGLGKTFAFCVGVCYNKGNIVMGENLSVCLQKLFGPGGLASSNVIVENNVPETVPELTPMPDEETPPPVAEDGVLSQVRELYALYKQYNAQGDFENAGKVMQEIDKLLTESAGTEQ